MPVTINEAVLKMPEGRLATFLDRENIGGGETIPKRIRDALRETIYFIGVATNVSRRSFDWCGLELGFYQGSFDVPARREGCLYHLSYPQLFTNTKNFKVQSLAKEHRAQFVDSVVKVPDCEIYSFLKDLADLNAKLFPPQDPQTYYNAIPKWCEEYAKIITNAFFATLQTRVEDAWYPQGRINISVENGDFFKTSKEFPADVEVLLSPTAYNIFSVGIPDAIRPMNWEAFKLLLQGAAGNDILSKILSDVALSALPSKADAKGDSVYQAPNLLFYRVLLVKHSLYGSKRREFTFNLIKTLEKVRSGSKATTALVAGIVLGSKYRSLFLEENAKYAPERMVNLEYQDAVAIVNDLLQDLDRIHADAAADGLANHNSLQSLLGDNPQIKRLFDEWWTIFPQMESAALEFTNKADLKTFEVFISNYKMFVETSRKNNHAFLVLCLEAYRAALPP
jgi:hypothetical protein